MENGSKEPEYLTVFMCFILAMLGGTAKELSNYEATFRWRRFFSNVIAASFCGILIGLLAPDFDHKNWIMAISGLAGYSGTEFINFCSDVLKEAIKNLARSATDKKKD